MSRPSLISEVRETARGRWPGVLRAIGVDPAVLNGKHQPCPMCGGEDRFRFTDHLSEGRYFCSGCGPGDGFDLVVGVLDVSMRDAAKEIRNICGGVPEADEVFTEPDVDSRKNALNSMWQSAGLWVAARRYLTTRGCFRMDVDFYQDLRGGNIWHKEEGRKMHAMLALVRDPHGRPVSIHRTFLDEDGKRFERKMMPPVGDLSGSSIRLGNVEDKVIIGEGIETVLSGCLRFEWPGMAAISANMMQMVKLPASVKDVIILADNDKSFTGQAAAFTLARRLDNEKRRVSVYLPQRRGDFNDDQDHYHIWDNQCT
jgi:putative DNA primase/helicase